MQQNILEARVEFKENQLTRVTVLVEMSKGDVRAIFMTTKSNSGYGHIAPGKTISHELLEAVADYGMETVDRDEIFPNWRAKYLAKNKASHGS